MKLIRITDDRYVLDAGPEITAQQMEMLRDYWKAWFEKHLTAPEVFVIGGVEIKLEYEDRRESDIEGRVAEIERRLSILYPDPD